MRFQKYLLLMLVLASSVPLFAQPNAPNGTRWFHRFDANRNGTIEAEEYRAAADFFFKEFDKNGDQTIDETERPRPMRPPRGGRPNEFPPPDERPRLPENAPPAPFFIMESIRGFGAISRAEFEQRTSAQFALLDADKNGVISTGEAEKRFEAVRKEREERAPQRRPPLDSPTARFIGAEMRFGDKQVKNAPFSAEISIETTRRLFDGSTITKQTKGAFYRDSAGRTRREQPLEAIGGFSVVGENGAPQKLIFINDFAAKTQYFLDTNRKTARPDTLPDVRPPLAEAGTKNAKNESLGTKILEGVSVEGTRETVEIPAGQIGNDKPLAVVTEKWFSPELQVVVMSRYLDPLAGEHIFRLVNIKKGEPAAELFSVPNDYKIAAPPKRQN